MQKKKDKNLTIQVEDKVDTQDKLITNKKWFNGFHRFSTIKLLPVPLQ